MGSAMNNDEEIQGEWHVNPNHDVQMCGPEDEGREKKVPGV